MKNLQSFSITPLGATNTLGTRTKITDNRFNKSKIISYDYSLNSHYDNAKKYLEGKGYQIAFLSETKTGYILLTAPDIGFFELT